MSALGAGPPPALLHGSLLMSAVPLTHISRFATVLIPSRYPTDCPKDILRHTVKANFLFFLFPYLLDVLSSVIKTMNKKWKWWLFILSVPWQTVCAQQTLMTPGCHYRVAYRLWKHLGAVSADARCFFSLLMWTILHCNSFCCSLWSAHAAAWLSNK